MSMIDITKGFRQYTPEELREYALKGLVCCGEYPMVDFLEHLLEGAYSASDIDEAKESAYDEGYEAGKFDGDVSDEDISDTLEKIQKAINILKEI